MMIGKFTGMNMLKVVVSLLFFITIPYVQAERLKDIANIAGVRNNPLIGYGLVVGLDGTGDHPVFSLDVATIGYCPAGRAIVSAKERSCCDRSCNATSLCQARANYRCYRFICR